MFWNFSSFKIWTQEWRLQRKKEEKKAINQRRKISRKKATTNGSSSLIFQKTNIRTVTRMGKITFWMIDHWRAQLKRKQKRSTSETLIFCETSTHYTSVRSQADSERREKSFLSAFWTKSPKQRYKKHFCLSELFWSGTFVWFWQLFRNYLSV